MDVFVVQSASPTPRRLSSAMHRLGRLPATVPGSRLNASLRPVLRKLTDTSRRCDPLGGHGAPPPSTELAELENDLRTGWQNQTDVRSGTFEPALTRGLTPWLQDRDLSEDDPTTTLCRHHARRDTIARRQILRVAPHRLVLRLSTTDRCPVP